MTANVTETKNLHSELYKLNDLESAYARMALLLEPTAESDTASINVYIRLLQGIERCIKLRMALNREAKPEKTETEDSGFVKVDLERISDSALREVKAALIRPKTMSNHVKSRKEENESKLKLNRSP